MPEYDGLRLEIQIRTKLQHIWATAVETMGTFLSQSLKSSEGPDDWLNFFALMGSAFAYLEECPVVPEYRNLSKKEIFESVIDQADSLKVIDKLQAFRIVNSHAQSDFQTGSYYLILLDVQTQTVNVERFGKRRLEEANEKYTEIERRILDDRHSQVVLVSATSLDSLRRAYPNYFLDRGMAPTIAKIGHRLKALR